MNHPSIGGKEQEPQSSDAPKELVRAVTQKRWAVHDPAVVAYYDLAPFDFEEGTTLILDAVPPGWMKTEQGWVQVERAGAYHTKECLGQTDGYESVLVGEEGCLCAPGIPIYRVKQPSED